MQAPRSSSVWRAAQRWATVSPRPSSSALRLVKQELPGSSGLPLQRSVSVSFSCLRARWCDCSGCDQSKSVSGFPPIASWIPHVLYTHLVLQDYLAARIPEKMVVCPEDVWRNRWQDWRAFEDGLFAPMQPMPGTGINARWPYSSSYQVPPCTYDRWPPR